MNENKIADAIREEGFSTHTIALIDNYISQIFNGKKDLTQFNQAEHAGLCCAGEVLIGAYLVCNYARTSLTTSGNASECEKLAPNWQIDEFYRFCFI